MAGGEGTVIGLGADMGPKDVFLCHTKADKDWVKMLASRLEAELVGERRIGVFFDEWDIDAGQNILTRIEEGLEKSRLIAVVLSPALTRADWPRLEWQSQVYADPAGRLARIIPILHRRRDPLTDEPLAIPLPLRMLKWIDFSDDKRFEASFDLLLRKIRGQPPRRGLSGQAEGSPLDQPAFQQFPDSIDETLFSNLFPIARWPRQIWSDFTSVERKQDVWSAYRHQTLPPFAIHKGRLFSFVVPTKSSNPFAPFLAKTDPRAENPQDWLSDQDRARILVGLLNSALREHCYQLKIHVAKEGTRSRFYCPVFKTPRKFRWAPRARPRTLAILRKRPNGQPLGVHHAARMAFIHIGAGLYVIIEPTYVFTSNGITPLQGKDVARFAAAWGGRERNAAVLRNVIMWARLLAGGATDSSISVGDDWIQIRGVPARVNARHGIEADTVGVEKLFGGSGGGEFDVEADASLERLAVLESAGLLDVLKTTPGADPDSEGPAPTGGEE